MMDFFAQQDAARAASIRLVWLFAVAVVLLIAALNAVAAVAMAMSAQSPPMDAHARILVHLWVSVGTLGLIGIGSWWRSLQLRAGGSAVAASLGGRRVNGDGADARERQLLNIIEEMSIASGVPMPEVYVLDEAGINAFAAGHSSRDAVVAVTRGAMERLSRDELQGVIGHEFSHLLNGDMRLNLRLMGLVYGILLISICGQLILRAVASGPRVRSSGDSKKGGGGIIAILAIGAALWLLGSLGHFFGRAIQASVSRRRESLADAASVQFTRNPAGLANALKKLGAGSANSVVKHAGASEASHLFFGEALRSWTGLLDTHPPLAERIRAIDPQWDGAWPATPALSIDDAETAVETDGLSPVAAFAGSNSSASRSASLPLRADTIAAAVGTVSPEHVAYGAAFIATLPPAAASAAREPYSARAVALALTLGADAEVRAQQLDALMLRDPALAALVRAQAKALAPLGAGARLPLLDLAAPALRQLSQQQRLTFLELVALNAAVADLDLDAAISARLLGRLLAPVAAPSSSGVASLTPLLPATAELLSALAVASGSDSRTAFATGVRQLLGGDGALPFAGEAALDARRLDGALDQLATAAPGVKRRIITACASCVAADGMVTLREAELLRLAALALGCPLPPFLDRAAA